MAGLTKKQQALQAANSDLLTIKEFAKHTGVSTRTISTAIDKGEVVRDTESGLIALSSNKGYFTKKENTLASGEEVAKARARIVIAEAQKKEAEASMLAMKEAHMRGNTIHAEDLQRIFREGWSAVASQFHLQAISFLQKIEGKEMSEQLKVYKKNVINIFNKVKTQQENAWKQQARKQKKVAEKNID